MPEDVERSLPPELREERNRRAAIAAVAAFTREKPGEPSLEEIAAQSGIAPPELLRIFRSRDALLGEACTEATLVVVRPISATGKLDEPWPERVAAALGGLLGVAREDPPLAELCLVHTPRFIRSGSGLGREAVVRALAELIEGGAPETPTDTENVRLAEIVAAGTVAVVASSLRAGSPPAPKFGAELVELTLRPFIGAEEASRVAKEFSPGSSGGKIDG